MAHKEQFDFVQRVKSRFPDMFTGKKVLECGSLDLNGSVRRFFDNCEYIGLDIYKGDGVDVVAVTHEYCEQKMNEFDVVISCEMLEHDIHYRKSMASMYYALKHGGLLILSCAYTGRPEHGTTNHSPLDSPATNDYYNNLDENDFFKFYNSRMFSEMGLEIDYNHKDIFFWGIKK